jgi:pimeloyl-ACP methyl ester carboxylesterase
MTYVASPATLVLVHGAFHGAWCWDKVTKLLDSAGVPSIAVDLPLTDFESDVETTSAAIEDAGSPVVLVGHSYSGSVITEAGNHPAVRHLVYVSAVVSEPDGTIASSIEGQTPTGLVAGFRYAQDGTITVDRDVARECFYADCDPVEAEAALDRLRPLGSLCFSGAVKRAAWREKPSTYALCTDDRALDPISQRELAVRCTKVVEWPTSHSPFLSRPELVAELLVGLAVAVESGGA